MDKKQHDWIGPSWAKSGTVRKVLGRIEYANYSSFFSLSL
jgi:hypothetical protein